eukprot:TRINITY_DN9119_c0_g1_i1.p1 TRINITY_DN9119_c0_g1~~TRINITY_DN9119_c0_g1_i1.p1  ORF type:complete len:170 (-),score=36.85 TRINITY_DN9119_c0_g1_i1:140-649(-)
MRRFQLSVIQCGRSYQRTTVRLSEKDLKELDWQAKAREALAEWNWRLHEEDEGFGEGFLPNEWEDGENDDWVNDLKKKGDLPASSKVARLEESQKDLVFREAAGLAKAVISNSSLDDLSIDSASPTQDVTITSLMDKLAKGSTTFDTDEQELLAKLKALSDKSERRAQR